MPTRKRVREDEPASAVRPARPPTGDPRRLPPTGEPRRSSPERRPPAMTAATAGQAGLRHIAELTARETEGVTRVRPEGDGWLVGVEVVEDRRIPSSGDILALYEAELDAGGELLSYQRVKRYRRGSGGMGEGP
ncbi:gas vesicle protein GvpO [Nonomuraea glycinis]|uniref:gas vesicle protein GvpO n=1 Tax=Nonomuraea glycinis TaxID=2047744 RepID=UPI002E138CB3|nr:gas vesicle protein [Nonomuraea glycinis]